ncbi:helix-turn-helix domain-containing protein [Streptomyces sp. NPDC056002]|uniref:helix-turn-helix domain-containing protein n=1 Tax=Streptomyces sp. NPDC056002 TaxID=3345675 RepID=UPI0035E0B586
MQDPAEAFAPAYVEAGYPPRIGGLVFHVFAALAEFIRELIVQGTHEGLAATRARGERIGRPPAMTEEQIPHAHGLLTDSENTITSIAKLLDVSRTTLYKYVPKLAAGRQGGERGVVQDSGLAVIAHAVRPLLWPAARWARIFSQAEAPVAFSFGVYSTPSSRAASCARCSRSASVDSPTSSAVSVM